MSLRLAAWLALALAIVGLDQLTKWWMLDLLAPGRPIPVTGFFQLVLVHNPGAAFSFLSDQPGWQRWFFTGVAVLISGWLTALLHRHQQELLQPLAFSMIIGGAIGNVIDRLVRGAVVDFLYFHIGRYGWPAFNLADSAITLGVILMLWAQFHPPGRPSTPSENPS